VNKRTPLAVVEHHQLLQPRLVHAHAGGGGQQRGGAVQVDRMKPKLKPPGNRRLKLKYHLLWLTSTVKFNLRHYTVGGSMAASGSMGSMRQGRVNYATHVCTFHRQDNASSLYTVISCDVMSIHRYII